MKILDSDPIDCEPGADGVYRPVDRVEGAIGAIENFIDRVNVLRNAGRDVRDRIRSRIRAKNPTRRRRNPKRDTSGEFLPAEES